MKQKHATHFRELFATIGCLVESGAGVENTPQWKWRLLISYDGTQYSGLLSLFLKFSSRRKQFLSRGALCGSYIQLSPTWAWCCFFIVMGLDWSVRSYRAIHEIDFGHRLAIAASLYYSTTDGWGCCFQSDKMFTRATEGCRGRTDWYRCPCLGSGKVDGLYLVTFCCLLPYMTRIIEVEIFCVCICIWRSQDLSHKVLKLILSCYLYQSPSTLSHKGHIGPP